MMAIASSRSYVHRVHQKRISLLAKVPILLNNLSFYFMALSNQPNVRQHPNSITGRIILEKAENSLNNGNGQRKRDDTTTKKKKKVICWTTTAFQNHWYSELIASLALPLSLSLYVSNSAKHLHYEWNCSTREAEAGQSI